MTSTSVHVMVVGDAAVGKTTLLHCYASKGFTNPYIVPVFDEYPIEVHSKEAGEKLINLYLTDARALDRHQTLRLHSYRRRDIFLICFSIADKKSLRSAKNVWFKEIKQHMPGTPVILVGTKSDLRKATGGGQTQLRLVPTRKAKEKAKFMGAEAYIECSGWLLFRFDDCFFLKSRLAYTQSNVESLFQLAVDVVLAKKEAEKAAEEKASEEKPKRKWSCV
ncbi:unnamed protein product [Dibothriocephalus latus]|uniref:Uncharacterized protein n=1 Tax=Dibothriocephalus latus TaxID=60516 RepID=A0A3P7LH83_DIBLA|nr:unnamed protein product [Dibothriocephalus latus]